jgi:hypothetical protein
MSKFEIKYELVLSTKEQFQNPAYSKESLAKVQPKGAFSQLCILMFMLWKISI